MTRLGTCPLRGSSNNTYVFYGSCLPDSPKRRLKPVSGETDLPVSFGHTFAFSPSSPRCLRNWTHFSNELKPPDFIVLRGCQGIKNSTNVWVPTWPSKGCHQEGCFFAMWLLKNTSQWYSNSSFYGHGCEKSPRQSLTFHLSVNNQLDMWLIF